MAKREYYDRDLLITEIKRYGKGITESDIVRALYDAKPVTEQDIVKSYLEKISKRIEEIENNYGLDKATKYGNKDAEQQAISYSTMFMYEIADITDEIKDFVNNLLSEQGDKE